MQEAIEVGDAPVQSVPVAIGWEMSGSQQERVSVRPQDDTM